MPRRRFIDKKTAHRFHVLPRPQHEIHDEEDEQVIFEPGSASTDPSFLQTGSTGKQGSWQQHYSSQTLDDLSSQYGGKIRKNEGEAAEYGIYYDDTEYDYMQHVKAIGGESDSVWTEAPRADPSSQSSVQLEAGLQALNLSGVAAKSSAEAVIGSTAVVLPPSIPSAARSTYSLSRAHQTLTDRVIESQLAVPTEIAGFQPDLDWRLREALEALEDPAFVDGNDDQDLFSELTVGGEEISLDEFEREGDFLEDDDDGWESDDTVKATANTEMSSPIETAGDSIGSGGVSLTDEAPRSDAYLAEFAKFKSDQKAGLVKAPQQDFTASVTPSATPSSRFGVRPLPPATHTKKRKGAATNPSTYSMSSSVLSRTAQQSLLDERFDVLEAKYGADIFDDEDDEYDGAPALVDGDDKSVMSARTGLSRMSTASAASGFSVSSRASAVREGPRTVRTDFNSIVDEFLEGTGSRPVAAGMSGRSAKVKRGQGGVGLRQLDEIRSGLGSARLADGGTIAR